jgi:hypothetical protein
MQAIDSTFITRTRKDCLAYGEKSDVKQEMQLQATSTCHSAGGHGVPDHQIFSTVKFLGHATSAPRDDFTSSNVYPFWPFRTRSLSAQRRETRDRPVILLLFLQLLARVKPGTIVCPPLRLEAMQGDSSVRHDVLIEIL